MAIKRRRHKHGREGRKEHADELSARLAPLEELKPEMAAQPAQSNNGGYSDTTIKIDRTSVKAPDSLTEGERNAASIFRPEPLVVVIVICMLAFIAFIAWQITEMPPK